MEIRARVIKQEKGLYTIDYDGNENIAEVSGKFRYEAVGVADFPAVGDYVVATWPEDGSHSIISSIFPRKSSFVRRAAGNNSEEQVVAANIDTVFICMSLNQDFNLRRLERYVSVAWDSGATPVIVLTKADLCEDTDEKTAEVSSVAIGVDIITTSSKDGNTAGVSGCIESGKTYAFIGSSGVGKSTLINALIGESVLRTSEIRENDDKGRHTTTHRELIRLNNGAFVIDTPGMRELGIVNSEEGVETAFSDIEELISQCRFSDCSHTNEPGCRVLSAITEGSLSADRWNSYQKLITENLYNTNESEYLKAKKAKFKEIAKINRKHN